MTPSGECDSLNTDTDHTRPPAVRHAYGLFFDLTYRDIRLFLFLTNGIYTFFVNRKHMVISASSIFIEMESI